VRKPVKERVPMKTIFNIAAVAVLLLVVPSPCFALWEIAEVTKEEAKKMGMEVRSTPSGSTHVQVELEFKLEGELKGFSQVDLRVGERDKPLLTTPLREDRSKPGRVVVSFTVDRTQVDMLTLWVMVPGMLGGTVYDLQVKDFVELKKKP
jgi:hypothetical protein